jgi:DNA-binding NarL/FixJ family response regulator
MNQIRVLLLESEFENAQFIQEAFAEMEEATRDGAWMHCLVTHVDRGEDAVLLAAAERPDVIIFSSCLPDSRGMETFYLLRDAYPGIPMIALLESGEEGLGRRMLREGLQDYLDESGVDCDVLARAIMKAIERQRYVRAATHSVNADFETGLPGREALETAGARDVLLAGECGRSLWLITAEIDNVDELSATCGRFAARDAVLQAGIAIRNSAGDQALAARVGPGRFAILDWQRTADEIIGAVQHQVQTDHQEFAFVFGHACIDPGSGLTIREALQSAEEMLCENKLAYSDLL